MPSHTMLWALLCLIGSTLSSRNTQAQDVSVSLQVTVDTSDISGNRTRRRTPMAMRQIVPPVVAWLTPADGSTPLAHRSLGPARNFVLFQKNKMFSPHLLVVPTGSSVDFPNLDPFFHNVFSLFNGRRFDLGLYEAGRHRSVRFDNDGVSYIFCNIHPEMGAIVISLSTPYYAISDADGTLTLPNIPSGEYLLNLWSENVSPVDLPVAQQHIHVSTKPLRLPTIVLKQTARFTNHLNKFGDPYKKPDQAQY